MKEAESVFSRYYANESFVDRFAAWPDNAVDVIIPVIHTNELWEANLRSIYREVPINRLLISDGGCIDDSIEIAKRFPRVEVFDHSKYVSLGYSIRKLIEAVEAEWFIYLHSDVYLPAGWFEAMKRHQREYDWFGCPMRHTVMVEYQVPEIFRPYAGSQMGRKKAFEKGLARIDDDYVYRQEDFVFAELVEHDGYRHGKVDDTFHYHQTMFRPSKWYDLKVKKVTFDMDVKPEEQARAAMMQVKGVIKYLQPSAKLSSWIMGDIIKLTGSGQLTMNELMQWIRDTNPAWLNHIKPWRILVTRLLLEDEAIGRLLSSLWNLVKKKK